MAPRDPAPSAAPPAPPHPEIPPKSSIDAIAELGRHAAGASVLHIKTDGLGDGLPPTVPVLFDHRLGSAGLQSLHTEIEKYRLDPLRRIGTARATTRDSFIALVQRHALPQSVLFAKTDWPNPQLLAVIDYHAMDEGPGHLQHRVVYDFPVSDEFKAWSGNDAKAMTQQQFAEFCEERVCDLAAPTEQEESFYSGMFRVPVASPADMVTLSRGLQVNVESVAKSTVTLQSGEGEIMFAEQHLDNNRQKLVVPGLFMICAPAFVGGDPVRLPARLRYRVAGGKVSWQYHLFQWRYWIRQRVIDDLTAVAEATGLPAYEGAPEA